MLERSEVEFTKCIKSFCHLVFYILVMMSTNILGCGPSSPNRSQLLGHYDNNFVGLDSPTVSQVKTDGIQSGRFNLSYDHVWDSMVLVIMQYAPVVRADKARGFLVAPPFALYAEKGDRIQIYGYFMKEIYKNVFDPTQDSVEVPPEDQKRFVKRLLGQVETQALANTNLQMGGRWSYLLEH